MLAVERSAARLKITCRKEGYREATVELPCVLPGSEAANALRFAPMMGPLGLLALPAMAIGPVVAANREGAEPGVCAYGAGSPVQVEMER